VFRVNEETVTAEGRHWPMGDECPNSIRNSWIDGIFFGRQRVSIRHTNFLSRTGVSR